MGDVDADIQTQKAPGQDGSTPTGITLSERYIPIEVMIIKDLQSNRQKISRVFNPKLGPGLLVYENDIAKREILATSEHVPIFDDVRPRLVQRTVIDLVCHNPFWTTEQNTEQLVVWDGGMEFPLQLPTMFAQLSSDRTQLLVNDGDVETPIFITFTGAATAPIKVKNVTTGESIQINQNLLAGEKLEIDTTFGKKRVTKVLVNGTKQNAFHYIKVPESTFFGLEVGNNLIEYSTGGEYENAGVSISWKNRFLGV